MDISKLSSEGNNTYDTIRAILQDNGQGLQNLTSMSQQLQDLHSATQILNDEIQNQISHNYNDFMSETIWLQKLEVVLKGMQDHMQILLFDIDKLRHDIIEPIQKIETAILILKRLLETSDLIRKVLRVVHLQKYSKEQDQSASGTKELEALLQDPNLRRICILENAKQSIETQNS